MQRKDRFKFFLNVFLTPVIIAVMVYIAIAMRDKSIIERSSGSDSQTEVLNIIDHTHTRKVIIDGGLLRIG